MTACHRQPAAAAPQLIQLRRRYTAAFSRFQLTVQTDAAGWMARVCSSDDGSAVYSALRCSLGAAKIAAAEFAVFRSGEATTPERMAQQLGWQENW